MTPFLKQVADHYYDIGDISSRCFVFPNRRSMVFFTKYLCEAVAGGTPVIAPQMLTINDLFYKASGLQSSDRVRLLLELYECYRALNSKAESLDEFIFWGDVILGDFDDVDKYLVDASQLFTNVADYKALQDTFEYLTQTQRQAIEGFLSHFNDQSGRLTVDLGSDNPDVKSRFLQIWNILHPIYLKYREILRDKGLAYEGMVYRDLAERLKSESVSEVFKGVFPDTTKFVFIGLNALNECEKTLLRRLRDAGLAEFCWDWSGDMIRDPQNRSSYFMAANVEEFPQAYRWDPEGVQVPQVNVVSISSSVGQAKRLPDILNQIVVQRKENSLSVIGADCAVVLPDETLLRPVLNAIPLEIKDINVTMGLQMTGSLFYSMMSDVASIQLHMVNRKDGWYFYHKQVWDLFSSEIFKKVADEATKEEVASIRKAAKYYIPQSDLCRTPLLSAVFRPVVTDPKLASIDQIKSFADYQKELIRTVAALLVEDCGLALELEYAKEYYRSVNILQTIALEVLPLTYIRLLNQILGSVSVPFRGEPLKGLQIMGPLETRALDFKDVVVMSANEGIFPRRSVSSSFVPPELRRGFGMPTYEYQDAVWAYYFYRMISRAERVWMLVDSRTEGLKSGEESRYVKQLEYHFGVPVRRYVVKFDTMSVPQMEDITKTGDDVALIKDTELSATTLQNYLACPAKFYYSTVKGLRPEEEVAESLDYGMFGTVYHDTMRALYTSEEAMSADFFFNDMERNHGLKNEPLRRVEKVYLESWLSRENDIRAKVKALIMSQLSAIEVTGRNLVVADVIVRYVMKTVQRDIELLESSGKTGFDMLGTEIKFKGEFCGMKFKGFVDRLDSLGEGQVRVVDYKTGKVLEDDENIDDTNAESIADSIFSPDTKDRPKIALQFYIYDMLLQSRPDMAGKIIWNSVYSTAHIFKNPPAAVQMNQKFYDAVSQRLALLLNEMCDTDVPFRRTKDEKICSYCDFKMICGR